MEKILLLFIIIIFSNCDRQLYEEHLVQKGKIKCGWYGKKTAQERRKIFPFNQASKVLLISFPDYELNDEYERHYTSITTDSILTPWGEKLPPFIEQHYVTQEAKTRITRPILDTFKLFNRIYSAYEIVELKEHQIDSLSHLMLNYKLNRTLRYATVTVSCCYKPRNAIVFLDKNENPILNYEICFQCHQDRIYPYNSEFWMSSCRDFDLYKAFFKQSSIHYGIDTLKTH